MKWFKQRERTLDEVYQHIQHMAEERDDTYPIEAALIRQVGWDVWLALDPRAKNAQG